MGTAAYRERAVPQMIDHLRACRRATAPTFLSVAGLGGAQDPAALCRGLLEAGLRIRWATDLKPERYLHAERAQTLRRAGAVACALGSSRPHRAC